MSSPYLDVRDLKKSFGLKPILRGIDLSLERGERVALLGANGAGKTTLLRILAGLTKPTGGSVSIDGLDITRDAQQVRRLVGFVAHQPYLYEELTALENLHFFARMYRVTDGREHAALLLRRVGLERKASERVGTLSRGQVQRLSLARALLHYPAPAAARRAGNRPGRRGQRAAGNLTGRTSCAGWHNAFHHAPAGTGAGNGR